MDGARLIQIGIRGPVYSRDDFEFHDEHGLEVIRIGDVKEHGVARAVERVARLRGRPAYCSFDIDAVDPAYAPATGTPEVGGLTSYEALSLVRGLRGLDLVGADVVEVAPPYDGPGAITSLLAANLLFELSACSLAKQIDPEGLRRPSDARERRMAPANPALRNGRYSNSSQSGATRPAGGHRRAARARVLRSPRECP